MAERFVRYNGTPLRDNRTAPQIDRDRIMYSSAFRRLASVTQVVGSDGIHVFHNRLTHSLQVAQIARRTAEFLNDLEPESRDYISPDVCEAAALAHDIGHPPFGHLAEESLNKLATENGLSDGFEGNAQSFRIVTKLAAHDPFCDGLDLTRATLNAILKYPWLKDHNPSKPSKWGAYHSEQAEFHWARELSVLGSHEQSVEAAIMDWADDVTYSVHDVEDFFKAGLIPLDLLNSSELERNIFCDSLFHREMRKLPSSESDLTETFESLTDTWSGLRRYKGHYYERQTLKLITSRLIGDFVKSAKLERMDHGWRLSLDPERRKQIYLLKQLTWHYVILNPALKTLQRGQQQIIRQLFAVYLEAIQREDFSLFPTIYCEKLMIQAEDGEEIAALIRTLIDMLASMTESHAIQLFHKLTGTSIGPPFHSS